MLRFDKPKLEGPVAAIAGSLIGGLIGGGGTLAGMASIGGLIGSAVGGLVGGSLLGNKQPSFPTSQAPGAPSPVQMPAASELPATGQSATPTTADLSKGELDNMKRRGRLSTILSQQNTTGESDVERLGG